MYTWSATKLIEFKEPEDTRNFKSADTVNGETLAVGYTDRTEVIRSHQIRQDAPDLVPVGS